MSRLAAGRGQPPAVSRGVKDALGALVVQCSDGREAAEVGVAERPPLAAGSPVAAVVGGRAVRCEEVEMLQPLPPKCGWRVRGRSTRNPPAFLHEATQIQEHLLAQDAALENILAHLKPNQPVHLERLCDQRLRSASATPAAARSDSASNSARPCAGASAVDGSWVSFS